MKEDKYITVPKNTPLVDLCDIDDEYHEYCQTQLSDTGKLIGRRKRKELWKIVDRFKINLAISEATLETDGERMLWEHFKRRCNDLDFLLTHGG